MFAPGDAPEPRTMEWMSSNEIASQLMWLGLKFDEPAVIRTTLDTVLSRSNAENLAQRPMRSFGNRNSKGKVVVEGFWTATVTVRPIGTRKGSL